MKGIDYERSVYRLTRTLALAIQLGAVLCLTPLNRSASYAEHIAAFIALSLIAWGLNLCSHHNQEHKRRTLARRARIQRYEELILSVLASAFALSSVVYIQFLPTRPIFSTALFLGGCAGYALTN
jgi:hypothetical protein